MAAHLHRVPSALARLTLGGFSLRAAFPAINIRYEPLTPSSIGIGLELSAVWTCDFRREADRRNQWDSKELTGCKRPPGKSLA